MTEDDVTDFRLSRKIYLEEQLSGVVSYKPHVLLLRSQWSGMVWPASPDTDRFPDTGVPDNILEKVGKASVTIPANGFVRKQHSVRLSLFMTLGGGRKFILV
jgi:probable 2-oxoglutarate dehydrogenase E1 component DHKTD1